MIRGMSLTELALLASVVVVALYASFILALFTIGRRAEARAVGGFIPDCLTLLRRLMGDERVPSGRKVALAGLIGYLAFPLDLVPDFIPVAGQLDDVIIAALVLRYVMRSAGPGVLRELWPGPDASLAPVLRLAYG
jgi:uncharacterized membrane protein YkvA (DUF1232 family)